MILPDPANLRVLILTPTAKDAAITAKVLKDNGFIPWICESLYQLCAEAEKGAGTAVIPEESIQGDREGALVSFLSRQPPWSDFSVIVLANKGLAGRKALPAHSSFGQFTLIERPMQIAMLVSTVRAALRDRQRQYKMRDHLVLLEKSEESLRNADRKKDEFLAMLSHELRNPLAAISNAVKLLNRTSTAEEIKKFARNTLEHQVNAMAHLINDLLDISRITSGKIVLKKEPTDLGALLERVLKGMGPQIIAAGHSVHQELRDGIWVLADPARLEQIFSNLLSNAIKYSNKGGNIWIKSTVSDNQAVVTFRDSGIGISPELLPKIFDLFTQAESSLARSQGGLGIGLTLVQRLIEMHDGHVDAMSSGKDKGSTFTIRIPFINRPAHSEPALSIHHKIKKGRRVLIVDDNQDAAMTLAFFLRDCGCNVQTAFDSKDAMDKAQQFLPEAALLDIGLPDINGYELAGKFQSIPNLQDTLLIAITGYNKTEDRKLSKISGFKHHLAKPVDHELLISLLA